MEETFKYLTKKNSSKQSTDPQSLYIECQNQVERLNSQLASYLQARRNQQFKVILPNINSISQQISNLKENICQQVTLEDRELQKIKLIKTKQSLLKRIDQHSHKIEKYKKYLQILMIDKEQLERQYQQNRKIINMQKNGGQVPRTSIVNKQKQIIKQIQNSVQTGRKLMSKQISLPSVFSQNVKLTQSIQTQEDSEIKQINQCREVQVDKLLLKIKNLQSDKLALQFVKCAKADHGQLKQIFKGFNTNMKIQQFLKEKQLKKELIRLQKKKQN